VLGGLEPRGTTDKDDKEETRQVELVLDSRKWPRSQPQRRAPHSPMLRVTDWFRAAHRALRSSAFPHPRQRFAFRLRKVME
jgi:hypothetical protein